MKIKKGKKDFDKISCGSGSGTTNTPEFPKQLNREDYFKCPIWYADAPHFVKDLNKASNKYIEAAKKNLNY